MQIPLQIAFKNVPHSDALEAAIRRRAAKMDRIAGGDITSCRVVVQEPNKRHQKGNAFVVVIDVTTPGAELTVEHPRGNHSNGAHEDAYVAVSDSFNVMERRLKELRAMRRREVKLHHPKPIATVSRFFPQDGYGFLTTPDGRELYFHANSVLETSGGADLIDVGSEVRFVEELGDQGPQATTVEIMR